MQHPYDWETDAKRCYEHALRMISLRLGVRRFKTIPEMYWQEQHGVIP
jgi:hypothetical protein